MNNSFLISFQFEFEVSSCSDYVKNVKIETAKTTPSGNTIDSGRVMFVDFITQPYKEAPTENFFPEIGKYLRER